MSENLSNIEVGQDEKFTFDDQIENPREEKELYFLLEKIKKETNNDSVALNMMTLAAEAFNQGKMKEYERCMGLLRKEVKKIKEGSKIDISKMPTVDKLIEEAGMEVPEMCLDVKERKQGFGETVINLLKSVAEIDDKGERDYMEAILNSIKEDFDRVVGKNEGGERDCWLALKSFEQVNTKEAFDKFLAGIKSEADKEE